MTDNEIIKALKDKINGSNYQCFEDDDVLDLIVRQQAEVEELKAHLKRVCAERDARICTNNFIKSEAVKEFAERLKSLVNQHHYMLANVHNSRDFGMFTLGFEQAIDIIVKEMVGDEV